MNIKSLTAVAALVLSGGAAFAQQTEFVAPDANFHASLTRAEVRNQLIDAEKIGGTAWQMHDGHDTPLQAGTVSREQVRAESMAALPMHHAGDVNDPYFGG
jgi:hypothetical protein